MPLFPPRTGRIPLAIRAVQPPTAQWVTVDDDLVVGVVPVGAVAGVLWQVTGRILRPNGTLVRFQQLLPRTLTPPAEIRTRIPLLDGYLLGVTVSMGNAGQIYTSRFFVRITLAPHNEPTPEAFHVLTEGYVDGARSLIWPQDQSSGADEGLPQRQILTGTDPAAGLECDDNINQVNAALRSWTAVLVTSATVGNRVVVLQVGSGVTLYRTGANFNQVASTSIQYSAGIGLPAQQVGVTTVCLPLPNRHRTVSSFRVQTLTNGLQVGDNWTAPVFEVDLTVPF